jgi:hypothetical protein
LSGLPSQRGIVSLCASGIAAARDPAAPYLGMTKAQILACAGEPHSRTCSASLVFENDKLVRVTFAHKDVRSPYQWQSEKDPKKAEKMRKEGVPTCAFSLPRCAPAQ